MPKLLALERFAFRDIIGIVIASFIIAIAIQLVIVPAYLLTGGLSGIAIILHFITDYPIWLWYIALNIPVFIAGYKLASRRVTVYSFVGMMSVSGFLALLSPLNIQLPVNDILLSALLGGTLNGVGVGLALIYRGSTGGLDIIAGIFHRLWGINFGTTIFITNVLVLGAALLTSNLYLTLYSALTMFVSSKMIDSVTSGFISKKTVLIVSKKSDDIANAILHRMHRGCTLLSGKGAYTGQAENIIMVTTGKTQVPHLKELIFSLDPQAFITITDTVEVYGRGFKPWDTEDV
jgi:uncharacterized membrane-anchored protein YitT (DUF2179 family)